MSRILLVIMANVRNFVKIFLAHFYTLTRGSTYTLFYILCSVFHVLCSMFYVQHTTMQ